MEKKELMKNLGVVLHKEENDIRRGQKVRMINRKTRKITYPNAEALIKIFVQIREKEDLKKIFLSDMVWRIEELNEAHATICLYCLVKLGLTKEVLNALKKREQYLESYRIINILQRIIEEGETFFEEEDLENLLEIIPSLSGYSSDKEELETTIVNIRFKNLNKKLKGINIEINQDKENLLEKIDYLGLDKKYHQFLEEIDKFLGSKNSNIINAGMVGNLREFMGGLFTDLAKKIAKNKNEDIPKYKNEKNEELSYMGRIRKYLKINLGLSENDNNFINGFVNILHSEGGHSFMATKEYFRLSKNIAIEIALFMATKYGSKFKTK